LVSTNPQDAAVEIHVGVAEAQYLTGPQAP
jgi:hypothetical protein